MEIERKHRGGRPGTERLSIGFSRQSDHSFMTVHNMLPIVKTISRHITPIRYYV